MWHYRSLLVFEGIKLRTKLYLGFGIVLFFVVVMALTGIVCLGIVNDELNQIINKTNQKIFYANAIIAQMDTMAVATRNIALSKDRLFIDTEKKKLEKAKASYEKRMEGFALLVGTARENELLEDIVQKAQQLDTMNEMAIEMGANSRDTKLAAFITQELQPVQEKLKAATEEMITYENELMSKFIPARAAYIHQSARFLLTAMGVIAVLIGGVFAILITRSITRPVNVIVKDLLRGSEEVAAESEQVLSSSSSLADGSQQQAAAVEETSASLGVMLSKLNANMSDTGESEPHHRKFIERYRGGQSSHGGIGRINQEGLFGK